jgi:hypothetical protein
MKEDEEFISHRIGEKYCPVCHHLIDTASLISEESRMEKPRPPKEGDFSLCLYCATILRFDADLQHRRAAESELLELESEDLYRLRRAQLIAQIRSASPRFSFNRKMN